MNASVKNPIIKSWLQYEEEEFCTRICVCNQVEGLDGTFKNIVFSSTDIKDRDCIYRYYIGELDFATARQLILGNKEF